MMRKGLYDSFFTKGYCRLPGMVPPNLLNRLRGLFDELMVTDSVINKAVYENKGKKYVTNLEKLSRHENRACLELLGYPPLLEIAEQICGNDFFLIQDFSVIKNLGDELPVLWHQDMVHRRSGNCFTMGIYLDDADEGDGALRVVAGSHLSNKTICELSQEPSVELPMKAGDILIHDMMLAHASAPLKKNALRRVIYFEFLSAAQAATENIYTKESVDMRTRLVYAASKYYQSLHPEEKPFINALPNPFDDAGKDIRQILEEIYSQPFKPRPSSYCLENTAIFSGT